jgi:hypothetical protein
MLDIDAYSLLKIHIFVAVVASQLAALFLDVERVPYFPIEVSRTAATGYYSKCVFNTGIMTLVVTMWLGDILRLKYALLYMSLVCIAYFDDVTHWHLHMFGVALLFLGAVTLLATSTRSRDDTITLIIAALIYLVRIALKAGVVLLFETWSASSSPLEAIAQKCMLIMYKGEEVCLTPGVTLMIFKLCAIGQWAVFWLFSELIHE